MEMLCDANVFGDTSTELDPTDHSSAVKSLTRIWTAIYNSFLNFNLILSSLSKAQMNKQTKTQE